jgi:hydroxymethylglutaryl-CoA lyase
MAEHVRVVEVGPRDGLQNEKTSLSVANKIDLVNNLTDAGLSYIETGSFVSPKWVPQMASSGEVFQGIVRKPGVTYAALTPNLKGYELAMASQADEVAVFAAASEGFSQKNINCSIAESIERFKAMTSEAQQNQIPVRGYVSCIFACPYDGETDIALVIDTCHRLFELGCYEVSLGDTTGVGTPYKTATLLSELTKEFPAEKLALHLHDTYGQALANVYAGLQAGIRVFDASVAGLGGCPYAKGASGNLATEDLVYLLNESGFETGIDLQKLVRTGDQICRILQRENQSSVAKALLAQA